MQQSQPDGTYMVRIDAKTYAALRAEHEETGIPYRWLVRRYVLGKSTSKTP